MGNFAANQNPCLMKKTLSLLTCAILLAGCSGGGKSGLKKNDYLGNLPALYADHALRVEAIEFETNAKGEKLMAGGQANYDKIQPLYERPPSRSRRSKSS